MIPTSSPPETAPLRTETVAGTGKRAQRARTEPMRLRPLEDGRTILETDGGTYVVDNDHKQCSCPDATIRGARCKHRRRVALEAAAGRLPPAGMRQGACAICGTRLNVAVGQPTALCEAHAFEAGELVCDRETDSVLIVCKQTTDRADSRRTDDSRLIANVETNANYGAHEPVIEAVYASATDLPAKRYGFPAGRLRHTDSDPTRGRRLPAGREALSGHQSLWPGVATV